jgi:hypothetical protein
MNCKRFERRRSWSVLSYHPRICLEELKEATIIRIRIRDLGGKIRTRYLPNTKQKLRDVGLGSYWSSQTECKFVDWYKR